MAKRNPHTGFRFDDFLKEEGIFAEVQAKALKRALAEQLEESMQKASHGSASIRSNSQASRPWKPAGSRRGGNSLEDLPNDWRHRPKMIRNFPRDDALADRRSSSLGHLRQPRTPLPGSRAVAW